VVEYLDRLKQGKLDSERKRGSGEQSDQKFGKNRPMFGNVAKIVAKIVAKTVANYKSSH
jgi:hypothetical protein